MSHPRLPKTQWSLSPGINVVLFAGLGGACQGLEAAGHPVHVAVNHDPVAIAAHRALHPHTHHIQGDIWDVSPIQATSGRPVNILWASPDCTDFSRAKGGKPVSDRVRSGPWVVLRWVRECRPNVFFMENVREIRGWGPLEDGRRDPDRVGEYWRDWLRELEALGYTVEVRDLCCADYGIATIRKRLFVVAVRNRQPTWMPETHAPAKQHKRLGRKRWRSAAEIIDWSLPMPSIFASSEEIFETLGLRAKRPLAERTLARLADAAKRYVLTDPFLVLLTHTHRTSGSHDLAEPLPTITTAKGGEYLVAAPIAVAMAQHNAGAKNEGYGGRSAKAPVSTLTVTGTQQAVVAASLVELRGTSVGYPAERPLATQTALGNHTLVAGAAMVTVGYSERPGQTPRTQSLHDPITTVVASAPKQAVVAASMVELRGRSGGCPADRPLATQTNHPHTVVAAACTTSYYSSGGQHADVRRPLGTVTCEDRSAVVAAILAAPPLSDAQLARARQVAVFLRQHGAWGEDELVVIKDPRRRGWLIIVDLVTRMLTPEEAAAAHGLILPSTITIDGVERPLTKTEAMRLVGNSVPPEIVRLLVMMNAIPLAQAAE